MIIYVATIKSSPLSPPEESLEELAEYNVKSKKVQYYMARALASFLNEQQSRVEQKEAGQNILPLFLSVVGCRQLVELQRDEGKTDIL